MDKPVYFELDGKYAAMLPKKNGGVTILLDPGPAGLADFMETGSVIPFDKLSEGMKKSIEESRDE